MGGVSRGFVLLSHERPQGQRIHSPSGEPVPGLHHSPGEKACHRVQLQFSMLPFVATALSYPVC